MHEECTLAFAGRDELLSRILKTVSSPSPRVVPPLAVPSMPAPPSLDLTAFASKLVRIGGAR